MTRGKYDDIIELPHHTSEKHPSLGVSSYAAQFSPFAALTGYEDIVAEAARYTDERTELGDDEAEWLSAKFALLSERIKENPVVTFTYFRRDAKKSGGEYLQVTSRVKRIDEVERKIYFTNGESLMADDVTDVTGEIFDPLFED